MLLRRQSQLQQLAQHALIIFLCGVLFIGVGGVILRDALNLQKQQAALDTRGERTNGLIVSLDTHSSGGRSSGVTTYYMIYNFLVAGRSYDNRNSVSQDDYERALVGNVVHVTYLADHPEISRVEQSLDKYSILNSVQLGYFVIGCGCLLAAVAAFSHLSPRFRKGTER